MPSQYSEFLEGFANASPGLALSIVQGLVEPIVNVITKNEEYDYLATTTQQRIIRIYVMNMFSVMIVIYASVTHMFFAA